MPRPARPRGFSLLELAVALVLLTTLLYFLVDRVLYMQEMGEKTEMEETLRSINAALRYEAASRMARGHDPQRQPLDRENPLHWLQTPPRNDLGEADPPLPDSLRPGWYYDRSRHELVYRPNRSDHLVLDAASAHPAEKKKGEKELRFGVEHADNPSEVRLISRFSYAWH